MADLTNEIFNLVGSFLFLIVAILFVYQTRRKNRNTPTLTTGFFVAFFGQFFNSILLILQASDNTPAFAEGVPGLFFNVLFVTALNLILVFLWIFLEQTNSTKVNTGMIVVVSSMFAAFIILVFTAIIWENIEAGIALASLIFVATLNIISSRSIYIQGKTFRATGQERTALLQLFAFVLIWVWTVLGLISSGITVYNVYFDANLLTEFLRIGDISIGDVFYYIGLLIFILTVLINPDYIYRLPLSIQDLVIISNIGFAVYGIGNNAQMKSLDEQLLAGFIVASNNFIQEMEPKKENEAIQYMQSSGRLLRLKFGDTIGVCIVSQQENWFLLRSMENLLMHIESKNPGDLVNQGEFFDDEEVRAWLKMYFPYLEIDSMQTY